MQTHHAAVEDTKIEVALICPRKLVLASYHALLSAQQTVFSVWPFCSTEALYAENSAEDDPHYNLVLYDIGFGLAGDAGEAMKREIDALCARIPDAAITILGDFEDRDSVLQAFTCAGVRGYIPTTLDPHVAVAALHLISAGGSFLPADCLRPDGRGRCRALDVPDRAEITKLPEPEPPLGLGCLTPREGQVLERLKEGKSNKLIAYELRVEEATVKVHVRNILKKLGATNRTQAAMAAQRILSAQAANVQTS